MHHRLQVPLAMLILSSMLQLVLVGSALLIFMASALTTAVMLAIDNAGSEILMMRIGALVWQGLLKLPQAALIPSGALTARAAYHVYAHGDLTAVRLGSVAAFVGPLIALVTNFTAILAFDCCGFVFGGVGRFVLVVVGVIAWVTLLQALNDPEVAALFDPGEDREEVFLRS